VNGKGDLCLVRHSWQNPAIQGTGPTITAHTRRIP
jgi:hypothetical protein